MNCLECGANFEARRSLHAHVKAHQMTLGDYYVKHFPRFDLWTKEPIPFKKYDDYVFTDFRNKKNMYKWLASVEDRVRIDYCRESFERYLSDGHKLTFAPNHLYFMTHPRLPRIQYFGEESLSEQLKKHGIKKIFTKELKECPDFENIPEDLSVLQDTREQQPLHFKVKSVEFKLDFGDYTAKGKDYSYLYVDRKAESDFKGTMSQGHERFCRELERVREFGSYLFIVVESDFRQIFANNNLSFKKKSNLDYVWENMRKIIAEYSDVCQFVFTGSRANSELVIPYLLVNGAELKNVDLQFYLEKFKCLG